MSTYSKSAATSAQGITYIQGLAAAARCVFHKIDQENDLGIDGILELIRDGTPLNRQIALQIKTGRSYWKKSGDFCRFSIGKHRLYWERHPLPVFGIVVADNLKSAAWVNLKAYLKAFPEAKEVKFTRNTVNTFDGKSFKKLFLPFVLGEIPKLDLKSGLRLLNSNVQSEVEAGLTVLFRRYPNERSVWEAFSEFLRCRPAEEIPAIFVYYLAHIPWHGDIFGHGEMPNEDTRKFVLGLFKSFGRSEILKLLCLVGENGIERGSTGQSVEAVVSVIPSNRDVLPSIIIDKSIEMSLRETAAAILAIRFPKDTIQLLQALATEGSDFSQALVQCIKEVGHFNPYA